MIMNSYKLLFTKIFIPYRSTYVIKRQYFNPAYFKRKCSPVKKDNLIKCYTFHTSSPKNALPTIILNILRISAQFSSILVGRILRKWWRKLPADEKQLILQTKVKPYKNKIIVSLIGFFISLISFYQYHLKKNPLTGRNQFILFSEEQIKQIANEEALWFLENKTFLPPTHPLHLAVEQLIKHIISFNPELGTHKLLILDDESFKNAITLPNGQIIVGTGILKYCNNVHQLMIVLCHELAHDYLMHIIERLSLETLYHWLFIIPLLAFWSIFPDITAIALTFISSNSIDVMLNLPFSRQLENEADRIGLLFAAKACADVREASVFWGKQALEDLLLENEIPNWLSTHPTNSSRCLEMEKLIGLCEEIRKSSKCSSNLGPDPRKEWQLYFELFKYHENKKK